MHRREFPVTSKSGDYAVDTRSLDTYLVPKRDVDVTTESLHGSGPGVGYTQASFAHLFERIA